MQSSGKNFAINASVSTVLHFFSAFVVVAIAPYAIRTIGLEAYGLWALVNTLTRYSLLADFGIGSSVTKHVAESMAREDRFRIRQIETIGVGYYVAISIPIAILGHYLGFIYMNSLAVSPALHIIAPQLLDLSIASTIISFLTWSSQSATLAGLGAFRVSSAINTASSLSFAAAAVTLMHLHYGIASLFYAGFCQSLLAAILGHVALRRRGFGCYLNPMKLPKQVVTELLGFGAWLQVATVSGLVIYDSPALIVSALLGVEAVGILDIGTRCARAIRAVSFNVSGALLPTMASRIAESGKRALDEFLPKTMRIACFVLLVAVGLLVSNAPNLLRLLFGNMRSHIVTLEMTVACLSVTYFIEAVLAIATISMRGAGKPWLESWYCVPYAMLNLGLSLVCTGRFHLAGTLASSLIGVTGGATIFFISCQKFGALSFSKLFGRWSVTLGPVTACLTFIFFILNQSLSQINNSEVLRLLQLTVSSATFSVVYVFILGRMNFFSEDDINIFQRFFPKRLEKNSSNHRVLTRVLNVT